MEEDARTRGRHAAQAAVTAYTTGDLELAGAIVGELAQSLVDDLAREPRLRGLEVDDFEALWSAFGFLIDLIDRMRVIAREECPDLELDALLTRLFMTLEEGE